MSKKYPVKVDTTKESGLIKATKKGLAELIVGQPKAIAQVANSLATLESGLRDILKPIDTLVFAGPSDCGKSFTAKALSQILLGTPGGVEYPLTFIQCESFVERHYVTRVVGAPPSYVDSHKLPLLHQYNIDQYALITHLEDKIAYCDNKKEIEKHKGTLRLVKVCLQSLQIGQATVWYGKERINAYNLLDRVFAEAEKEHPLVSIILFDEIEKAPSNIWDLLLGITQEGRLQLANNNRITNFCNSLIILTTNTGSKEIMGALGVGRIGFAPRNKEEDPKQLEEAIQKEALKALEKIFRPELMTRLGDRIIPFRPLGENELKQIFSRLINEKRRLLGNRNVSIRCHPKFKQYVIDQVVSQKAGPRMLEKKVKNHVEVPLSAAIASKEVKIGDSVLLTIEKGEPVLRRQQRPKKKKIKISAIEANKKEIEVKNNGHDKEASQILLAK